LNEPTFPATKNFWVSTVLKDKKVISEEIVEVVWDVISSRKGFNLNELPMDIQRGVNLDLNNEVEKTLERLIIKFLDTTIGDELAELLEKYKGNTPDPMDNLLAKVLETYLDVHKSVVDKKEQAETYSRSQII
jgi:hypothetical protein